MSLRQIKAGTVDNSVVIRIIDATTGVPEQAVEHNTAGIDMWYRREGGLRVAITEVALAALDTAHTDGGIEHIDDGYYRLDLPDAACAASAVGVMVGGAVTDMIVVGCYIDLVTYDPQDTVRLGLTALPNAAADAAGGLAISDAGGLDLDTKLANTNEVTAARMGALTDWINGERLDLLLDAIPTTAMRGTDGANTTTPPTVGEIQTEMEENGASILDTLQDRLTAARAGVLSDWIDGGRLDLLIDAIKVVADALVDPTTVAAGVWDRLLTGATHNIATSAGRRLREASDTAILRSEETAQGGAASTITLAAGASAIDNFYNTSILIIIDGTGVGQARTIKSYVGATKVATTCMNWGTNPDATSKYVIRGAACSAIYQMHPAVYDLINAEVDLALTDYDPPTKTEMDAAHALLATATALVTVDTATTAIQAVTDVLPDAGALTTIGIDAARLTAVRAAILTDWINGGRLDLLLDAVKAKTDNLPEGIQKNQAFSNFTFLMIDSTDHRTPKIGLTVSATRCVDGGSFVPISGSIAEVSSGIYQADFLAADTNGDVITYRFTASGADDLFITIKTTT